MGPSGGAVFITLTGPLDGPLDTRIEAMFAAWRGLQHRQVWKGKNGWKAKVGLVWAFELQPGAEGLGHPHLHQMVFAAHKPDLRGFVTDLLTHWRACFPAVGPRFAKVIRLTNDPGAWAPRLHYILKGTEVAPDWPDSVFDLAVLELTSGHQHSAAIGLMRPTRMARKKGGGPDVQKS